MNQDREAAAGRRGSKKESDLNQALRNELARLSFNAFEQCVGSLLRSLGYEDVHVRRDGKEGRNRDGGWDIEAAFPTGFTKVRTIVQAKQYDSTPVQKRYVDELRGGMLRAEAGQGLLITLSTFSDTAKEAAARGAIAPIRLIDGGELAQLMVGHGIGVTSNGGGRCEVDADFFERLRCPEHGKRPRRTDGIRPASISSGSPVTVVVVSGGKTRIAWKGDA